MTAVAPQRSTKQILFGFPHMVYAVLCSFLGRHDKAVLHAAKSVELDPLDLMTNFRIVQANYYARRYDEAVRTGRIAIELTPDSPYTCFYLALSLAAVGLKDEAWDVAKTGRKLNDGLPLGEGYFGYAAGLLGHTVEARSVVEDLKARREKGYSAALPIAWAYLVISEADAGLEWMEAALAEREPFLGSLMVTRDFRSAIVRTSSTTRNTPYLGRVNRENGECFLLRKSTDASLFRAVFFEPKPLFNQQLNSSRWPIYCDHSVTSADVRLSIGNQFQRRSLQTATTHGRVV